MTTARGPDAELMAIAYARWVSHLSYFTMPPMSRENFDAGYEAGFMAAGAVPTSEQSAEPTSDPIQKGHCHLCGEPMPKGEEMFKYHGYSGLCPTERPAVPDVPYDEGPEDEAERVRGNGYVKRPKRARLDVPREPEEQP